MGRTGAARSWVLRLAAAIAMVALSSAIAGAQTLLERTNRGVVELVIPPDTTSIEMAADLASVIDDGATRRLLPVLGRGSTQNLIDLKLLRGVDIAIIRTDVLEAARKQPAYAALPETLSFIAKLYNEELHVLARAATRDLAELRGKRVYIAGTAEPVGSELFERLGIKIEPVSGEVRAALQKLKNGEIEGLVYMGGKPISLFGRLRRDDGLNFLAVPLPKDTAAAYVATKLTAEDYPELIGGDAPVATVAAAAVLFAAPLEPKSDRSRNVANFVDAFFSQLPRLLEPGHHPKWREVNLNTDVPGWKRLPAAEGWLQRNAAASAAPLAEKELREAFGRFLDERSRLSGGRAISEAEKAEMFHLYQEWLKQQPPR